MSISANRCEPVPMLKNAHPNTTMATAGTVVMYSCDRGYIVGHDRPGGYHTRNCSNSGNYSVAANNSSSNYSECNYNPGNYSTGNYSIGNYNTGNYSTGNYSTDNYSTGNYDNDIYNITCHNELWVLPVDIPPACNGEILHSLIHSLLLMLIQ